MTYDRNAAIAFVAARTQFPLELVARVLERFDRDMTPEQVMTEAAALVVEGLDAELVAGVLVEHTAYRVAIGELDPSAELAEAAAAEWWIARMKSSA